MTLAKSTGAAVAVALLVVGFAFAQRGGTGVSDAERAKRTYGPGYASRLYSDDEEIAQRDWVPRFLSQHARYDDGRLGSPEMIETMRPLANTLARATVAALRRLGKIAAKIGDRYTEDERGSACAELVASMSPTAIDQISDEILEDAMRQQLASARALRPR